MKLISFVVPAYNSEKYLHTCIDSLLFDLEHVEIIIVNDGSKDNTIKIAETYQHMYPNTVKVINKLNGGHGSGINAGLEVATGLYFKVVDSDDWMDVENTKYLVSKIA
ncbi:MAG: glycosyltransferase family 2 protein [Acholeplasmataceae bacterium]